MVSLPGSWHWMSVARDRASSERVKAFAAARILVSGAFGLETTREICSKASASDDSLALRSLLHDSNKVSSLNSGKAAWRIPVRWVLHFFEL